MESRTEAAWTAGLRTGGASSTTGGCELPSRGEAPATLGQSPLQQLGEAQHTRTAPGGWFMELVGREPSADGQTVHGAGQGGVMAFDVTDPTAPVLRGTCPPSTGGPAGRYDRVEPGPTGLPYATPRDLGLDVLDAAHPSAITWRGSEPGSRMEGLAAAPPGLFVVGLDGRLYVFDISAPEVPVPRAELAGGLGSAPDLALGGEPGLDGAAWVASASLGVVPVDLGDPLSPRVAEAVDVGGGVQDVAVGDGVLYAAAGGAGVVTPDPADPRAPTAIDLLDLAGSVQSVSVDRERGLLWAVDQADVLVFDLGDPRAPVPLGSATTAEHAMHVLAVPGRAHVADRTRSGVWRADPSIRSPDIDLSVGSLLVRTDSESVQLTVRNTGAAPLNLLGATVDDARFRVQVSSPRLGSGEAANLRLRFAGGGDVDARLCLASDDPDAPRFEVGLHSAGEDEHSLFGLPAPDFTLEDLDGRTLRLAEQPGHPVLLACFASW